MVEGKNKIEPLVSISCIAFNQIRYIGQCFNGFLKQDTSFGIEILVHDDASTDGTSGIIQEYQSKYPKIFFPIYETVNQYSKGKESQIDFFNYRRAKGKYIAYCEGDDYWTDPLKLQKQVEFLESHPEYSACFTRCRKYIVDKDEFEDVDYGNIFDGNPEGVDVTMDMFFSNWITQPLTMVFRRSMFSFDWQKQYKYYRDHHEIYHLLQAGKVRLMNFDSGVYQCHGGGVHSLISPEKYFEKSCPIDEEFYRINPNKWSRMVYLDTLQTGISVYSTKDKLKALSISWKYFKVSHKFKRFLKQQLQILSAK